MVKYVVISIVLLVFIGGCSSNSTENKRLIAILNDDLEAIVTGVDPAALLDTPFWVRIKDTNYDSGKYRRLVEVHFYFLKDIKKRIYRKYRYNKTLGIWERFENSYQSYKNSVPQPDSLFMLHFSKP